MTREDIIRLAREAQDAPLDNSDSALWPLFTEQLDHFAALVAEAERKACAEIARAWDTDHPETNYGRCIAAAIEARGSK